MEYDEPLFFRVMQYAAAADRDVIDMVSGEPDWGAPPAIAAGLRVYAEGGGAAFQYPPSEGLRGLREAIAARRDVDPATVIVTSGAAEANYLATALALDRGAGDEVLLTDPVYPYYPARARLLGGEPVTIPTRRDGSIDPAAVADRAGPATALIAVNTPNNPTGAVYPPETMRELVGIAEDNDAVLASDEVYDHFVLDGPFESALAIDSDHRVVTNAFSKSMAITGFRVGYGVFPERFAREARKRHMLTTVAVSRPAQAAVSHALSHTGPEYYAENRRLLRSRIERFTAALDEAGAEYTTPEGAFYVLARFEGFPGTLENVERLIDTAGVAGMPGETFGPARSDWIRFALVTDRVEAAAARLGEFFA